MAPIILTAILNRLILGPPLTKAKGNEQEPGDPQHTIPHLAAASDANILKISLNQIQNILTTQNVTTPYSGPKLELVPQVGNRCSIVHFRMKPVCLFRGPKIPLKYSLFTDPTNERQQQDNKIAHSKVLFANLTKPNGGASPPVVIFALHLLCLLEWKLCCLTVFSRIQQHMMIKMLVYLPEMSVGLKVPPDLE